MRRMVDKFVAGAAAVTLALLALALAAGCSAGAGEPGRIERDGASYVEIVTDTETGVQYLAWARGGSGGITPLLDQWGFPLLAEGHQRGARVEPGMDVDDREMVDDE